MSSRPAHLAPSELGTKEYWDSLYATELANHADNPEDTGTVWFDDVDAESRMVVYLGELLEEDGRTGQAGSPGLRILDLGCGNGSLLRAVRDELADRDMCPEEVADQPEKGVRLLGVDYSEASIALAQKVVAPEGEEDEESDDNGQDDDPGAEEKELRRPRKLPSIELAVWDVLHGDPAALTRQNNTALPPSWDVVLDKGTFDAISLGAGHADASNASSVEALYRRQVLRLLRPGGRFLVTSCNWTETELEAWMAPEADTEAEAGAEPEARSEEEELFALQKVGHIVYPSFQFGGQQGQAVCTVCFEKRSRR